MSHDASAPDLLLFDASDEGPHLISDDPFWQESVVLHWYDADAGLGGMHRIGHEPNARGGVAAIWSFIFSTDGWRYDRCGEKPLESSDLRPDGFAAGSALVFTHNQKPVWEIDDGPLRARLVCDDFHPVVNPVPGDAALFKQRLGRNHFEAGCQVTGTVTYQGKEIAISGRGYRDHSWGPRDWDHCLLGHRWVCGTFGPDFSFLVMTIHSPDGRLSRMGYVARPDGVVFTDDVDAIIHLAPDGVTYVGGDVLIRLPGEAPIVIRCRGIGGATFQRYTIVNCDVIAEADWNGRKGYCVVEMINNPRNGVGPVTQALNAPMLDGFSPFAPINHWQEG